MPASIERRKTRRRQKTETVKKTKTIQTEEVQIEEWRRTRLLIDLTVDQVATTITSKRKILTSCWTTMTFSTRATIFWRRRRQQRRQIKVDAAKNVFGVRWTLSWWVETFKKTFRKLKQPWVLSILSRIHNYTTPNKSFLKNYLNFLIANTDHTE